MKSGYADINIVLDRSGSMESIRQATIAGFNKFLAEQKQAPGEATLTLAQFDDIYEVVHRAANLNSVEPLTEKTYAPRNTTALLDAIGKTINETGGRLAAMAEDERPERVIFVIITDGLENASQEFTVERVNEMIAHQRD